MADFHTTQLAHRGIVAIGGEDRRSFLQGLISNDIQQCTPDHPLYAALLTPQGKFLHDLFILDEQKVFLVDCESARADDLLKRLNTYKLRAKVTLENVVNDYEVWAMWGKDLTVPATPLSFADPRLPQLGQRMIVKKENAPEQGQQEEFAAYDKHRIMLGVPDGSRDMIVEKSTLLECNLDRLNAISWTKGCYMGQELTARMHHRGLVKKRLFPVTLEGPAPAFGALITLNGEEIGDMRSSRENVGLALLNIDKTQQALTEKATMLCGETRLTPVLTKIN
jgi:tRNA-modifying protein YgfZ